MSGNKFVKPIWTV